MHTSIPENLTVDCRDQSSVVLAAGHNAHCPDTGISRCAPRVEV